MKTISNLKNVRFAFVVLAMTFNVSASAAVFSYSSTGVITNNPNNHSYDGIGMFGAPGSELVGRSFALTASFDTKKCTDCADPTAAFGNYQGFGPYEIKFTIDNISYSFESSPSVHASYAIGQSFKYSIFNHVYGFLKGPADVILYAYQRVVSPSNIIMGVDGNYSEININYNLNSQDSAIADFGIYYPNADGTYTIGTWININYGVQSVSFYRDAVPGADASIVPEPSSILLSGLGLVCVMTLRRKLPAENMLLV